MGPVNQTLRRVGWWALPAVAILAVLSPMLFTGRTFNDDWFNHLWLVWNQHDAIADGGLPTYFTHTDRLGVYYPQFAFYGGTLYAIAGYLSFPLTTIWAYVATFLVGFALAAGGWSWLARQAGLRGWAMHAPGLVHVTAAYVLTNAYARGTWPEFMATSAIPMVAAAAWWLLRAARWRLGPAFAYVLAVVLLTGSHNITLAWGSVFLVLVAVCGALALGLPGLRSLRLRRVGAVLGLGVLALCVNAWFLLPDLRFASGIGVEAYDNGATEFNTLGLVLDPLRHTPATSSTPGLDVQMPVLALVWALVAGLACAVVARRRPGGWARLALGLGVLLLGFLALVTRDDPHLDSLGAPGRGLWEHLPKGLTYVQFAYRLNTYVLLCVCALVLVALVAVQRSGHAGLRRGLLGSLVAILAFNGALALVQIWDVPSSTPGRSLLYKGSTTIVPPTWSDGGIFHDRTLPVVAHPPGSIGLTLAQARHGGRSPAPVPTGTAPLATNVGGGPGLVAIHGMTAIGRTEVYDRMVVRRNPGTDPQAPLTVRVTHAASATFAAGIAISVAALAALLAGAVLLLRPPESWRWLRRRRRRRPGGRAATARPAGRRTAGR